MLEKYLSSITNVENYIDAIIVFDRNAKVVYTNLLHTEITPITAVELLGKDIFDVYPNINPEESTIMKALTEGKTTINHHNKLTTPDGFTFEVIDDTFPIRENGKIIGATCITYTPTWQHTLSSLDFNIKKSQTCKTLFKISDIIGRSEPIQTIRDQIQRIARTSSSVLIYGETGTGKEMVAQSIHTASNRKEKPFIAQNCAAIPATLLESIFFGTVKGSYSGAENRAGIFETANGGTIFLDEINLMDIGLQAKLLRFLEEKKITRIGSTKPIDTDVRIISAINCPPVDCMNNKTLRPDLFYRLGCVTINVPLLSDIKNDIDLLTEFYISKFNIEMEKNITGVSQDVMTIFNNYSWPGNVRELKNAIEGAFNICDSLIIGIGDLPSYILENIEGGGKNDSNKKNMCDIQWGGNLKKNMDMYEKKLIINAIKSHSSLTSAAAYLGISRQSLNQKINKYHLTNQ